jgi:hypothetical protein
MDIFSVLFLIFVHISLLVPGYVITRKTGWLRKTPGIELAFGYLVSIALFAAFATANYALNFNPGISRVLCWVIILGSLVELFRASYFRDLIKLRFPLICLFLMTLMSTAFIGLSFNTAKPYVPDPTAQPGRNYNVLAVKVINVAQTQANDNSIPYRQAQFFVNRTDPGKGDFINEWSVTFFQRTPLMGAVTANYMNLFSERLPVNYIWGNDSPDPVHTYLQFQLIAHVMNALFILPAFFLLTRLFNRKTAVIGSLFLVTSPFFMYNAVFSWPKSLVAFFILLSWLLLLEKKPRYTALAGVASGLAYLTHDLAILYISASLLLLLWNRRFREMLWFGGTMVVFAIPWLVISSVIYHKPSTFIYYPISIGGIPQPGLGHTYIHQFLHTSPLHLAFIRLINFIYLSTPFQLFTSGGGSSPTVRLWSLGLFSIPGSVGLGLMIPAIIGYFKKFRDSTLLILLFTPIISETIAIGWPYGLGALHFAEALTVLVCGLAVFFLTGLKSRLWLYLAFVINTLYLAFFVSFSYRSVVGPWFRHPSDLLILLSMVIIIGLTGWTIYKTAKGQKLWLTA